MNDSRADRRPHFCRCCRADRSYGSSTTEAAPLADDPVAEKRLMAICPRNCAAWSARTSARRFHAELGAGPAPRDPRA